MVQRYDGKRPIASILGYLTRNAPIQLRNACFQLDSFD